MRRCEHCETVLSQYNRKATCFVHTKLEPIPLTDKEVRIMRGMPLRNDYNHTVDCDRRCGSRSYGRCNTNG